jgi:hypothetical protein
MNATSVIAPIFCSSQNRGQRVWNAGLRARILDRSEASGRALMRRFLPRDRFEARELSVLMTRGPDRSPALTAPSSSQARGPICKLLLEFAGRESRHTCGLVRPSGFPSSTHFCANKRPARSASSRVENISFIVKFLNIFWPASHQPM